MPIGFSFQPGAGDIAMGGQPTPKPTGPSAAIEFRNLRIPNRQIPGSLAPNALLQSPGGGGVPDVELIKQLMQAFAPQQGQAMPMMPFGGSDEGAQTMPPEMPGGAGGTAMPEAASVPTMAPSLSDRAPRIIPGDRPNTAPVEDEAPPTFTAPRSLFDDEGNEWPGAWRVLNETMYRQ